MPAVTRVQSKKQALAGVMRIAVEGNAGAWPGDNPFQCAQGYNCGPPTITLDSFNPFQNSYIDVGAGGPASFTFTVSSNASWVKLSPDHGSISPKSTEQRVFVSVPDWSKVAAGANTVALTLTAKSAGQPDLIVPAVFVATNTKATLPSSFKGELLATLISYMMLMVFLKASLRAPVQFLSKLLMLREIPLFLVYLGKNCPA